MIVDNASTHPIADMCDVGWHPRATHVREGVVGLAAARFTGIETSSGDLIVFVDDDNLLAPDYLERAVALRAKQPRVAVFGAGRLVPEFETPPPDTLRGRLAHLAIRSAAISHVEVDPFNHGAIPWGAGLCVARQIAVRYEPFVRELGIESFAGPRGAALYGGDDDLFSWLAVRCGKSFGIFSELVVTHLIPSPRLTRGYFVQLLHDRALSAGIREFVLTGALPPAVDLTACARLVLHGVRRGSFSFACRCAEVSGAHRARRLVTKLRLQPVDAGLHRAHAES